VTADENALDRVASWSAGVVGEPVEEDFDVVESRRVTTPTTRLVSVTATAPLLNVRSRARR